MTQWRDFNFLGRRAIVLHPAATVREQLASRLAALGLDVQGQWPPQPNAVFESDVVFVDVDTGHDELFPWPTGRAPVPVIGLVRSEAPGRLTWALSFGIDAYLPVSAIGAVYSTLVVASAHSAERLQRVDRDQEHQRRNGMRHMLVRAVLHIMNRDDIDEIAALKQLRARAMSDRMPLEDVAVAVLAEGDTSPNRRRR